MRIATILLVLSAASAFGAPLVSPRVRMVARGELRAGAIGDPARPHEKTGDRALVTVRLDGGAERLRAAGFDAVRLGAQLAAVHATADELRRLAILPGVYTIEERRLLFPTLDLAGAAIGAPAARLETGLDGRGVLVGIVDTGADFHHADLRASDGKTRVAALLDLSVPADTRHDATLGPSPGAVWLADELDAQLAADAAGMSPAVPVTSKDSNGHGTHVSAIATSNGFATGKGLPAGRYVGVAPGAQLVVVQATHGGSSFTDVDVMAGLAFVTHFADVSGQPLVVNLSLGGAGGPHDGSSNLETQLDVLFPAEQAGRAVVVAAGNDGNLDAHASMLRVDGELVLPFDAPSSSVGNAQIALELWFAGALALEVESPNGHTSGLTQPGTSSTIDTADGRINIDDARADQPNHLSVAGITLTGVAGAPAAGSWKLHVHGAAGRFDAWIVESPPGAPFTRFTDHIAEDDRLSLPAASHNAITVGSMITRNSWNDVDGDPILRLITLGEVSTFSASGPTADGRFAPDLLAPGEFIVSALSQDALPSNAGSAFFVPGAPSFAWADGGVHGLLRGTSQAAPFVAGTCALLFQSDPTLSGGRVREILRSSARAPAGSAYGPRQGFGALDVLAALRYAGGKRGGTVSPATSSVGVSRDALPPGEDTTRITVTPRDAAGVPLGPGRSVQLSTSAGELIGAILDAGAGRYEQSLVAHAARGDAATVRATVDGIELAEQPSVYFVLDRGEIGHPFVAGGGCQAARTPLRPLWLALIPLLFLAFRKLRRTLWE